METYTKIYKVSASFDYTVVRYEDAEDTFYGEIKVEPEIAEHEDELKFYLKNKIKLYIKNELVDWNDDIQDVSIWNIKYELVGDDNISPMKVMELEKEKGLFDD